MLLIPITTKGERGPYILIMILEKENLERMKTGDPFDFHCRTLPFPSATKLNQFDLVIAYEEDMKKIYEYKDDLGKLLTYLQRNRTLEVGEPHGPVSLRKKPE